MKFDFIIGNPPYQEKVHNENDRPSPLYNKFMDAAYNISECVELITPARFLFDAGQTPKKWNKKMLKDEHLKVLYYNADPSGVFKETQIKGGVVITIRNEKKNYGAIGFFTKYHELNRILAKVTEFSKEEYIYSIVSPRGSYRLSEVFFHDFPFASERLGAGTGNMIASNFFEKMPEVWTDECDEGHTLGFYARVKNKRKICYISKKYVLNNQFIDKYNILFPKSNGSGNFGETLTEPVIIKPNFGSTDTFINIGFFDSLYEAESMTKYIKTKFMRTMLGIKKVTQDNSRGVWKFVPIQDFTPNSDVDWSQSVPEVDKQLYKKYRLSQEEIDFIETHVKEME